MNYIGDKGKNEFGGPTSPELNIDAALMYDVSPLDRRWQERMTGLPRRGLSPVLATNKCRQTMSQRRRGLAGQDTDWSISDFHF